MDQDVSPTQVFEYDIVITSYSHLAAEYSRIVRFKNRIKRFSGDVHEIPKRPHLTLLSEIFDPETKPWGQFLVLDEAHMVKRVRTKSHAAVSLFRAGMDTCVMLSGTPLDNTWRDGFGLLRLLRGHPFTSMATYINALSEPVEKSPYKRQPTGHYMVRAVQLFDSCILRRPQSTIEALLTVKTVTPVYFNLSEKELEESNAFFDRFQQLTRMAKKRKRGGPKAQSVHRNEQTKVALGLLIKAQQMACHPELLRVLLLEQTALLQSIGRAANENTEVLELDQVARRELDKWLQYLEDGSLWRSARVDVITMTIQNHHQSRPHDSMLIVDESVFFLSILSMAFKNVLPTIPVFSYDGRVHVAARDGVLQRFKHTNGPKILLLSRAAGGVGLNVQAANVVIQCCPWWKRGWEEQAVGRVHRPGQKKPVFVYQILATGCHVEMHKCRVRDEKASVANAILDAVTSTPAGLPKHRNCF